MTLQARRAPEDPPHPVEEEAAKGHTGLKPLALTHPPVYKEEAQSVPSTHHKLRHGTKGHRQSGPAPGCPFEAAVPDQAPPPQLERKDPGGRFVSSPPPPAAFTRTTTPRGRNPSFAAYYPCSRDGIEQGASRSQRPHRRLPPPSSRPLSEAEQSAAKHNGAHPSPGSGAEPAANVKCPSLLLLPQFRRLGRLLARVAALRRPESCGRARRTPPPGGALIAATVEGLPSGRLRGATGKRLRLVGRRAGGWAGERAGAGSRALEARPWLAALASVTRGSEPALPLPGTRVPATCSCPLRQTCGAHCSKYCLALFFFLFFFWRLVSGAVNVYWLESSTAFPDLSSSPSLPALFDVCKALSEGWSQFVRDRSFLVIRSWWWCTFTVISFIILILIFNSVATDFCCKNSSI